MPLGYGELAISKLQVFGDLEARARPVSDAA
jgi:hypothetical protein